MTKDRNRWEIILDILKVTNEQKKAKKNRIMQRAYLDWKNFERYPARGRFHSRVQS